VGVAHRSEAGDADAAERLRAAIETAGLRVESVRPVAASLEDVFIARLEGARS
jgi:hypothetical protein